MGEIDRTVEFRDLLPLGIELLLEFCGACELHVQPFPHVKELIFDNGEDVLRRHRWTGWSTGTTRPGWPTFPWCCPGSPSACCPALRRHILGTLSLDMLSGKLMPKTPGGHGRPADVVSNAVRVMKIATGEIEETLTDDGRSKAAVELGRKGGLARAKRINKAERVKIAKKAALARWRNKP